MRKTFKAALALVLLAFLAGCGGSGPPASSCPWPGGTAWTPQSALIPSTDILYTVTRSPNTWVAAGLGGRLITSPDGLNWTAQTLGTANTLLGSGVSPSHYLVVGQNGTILSAPLSTPSAWTPLSSPTTQSLYDVAYGAGLYVAVGNGGTILTSSGPPGWAWTLLSPSPTPENLRGVVYAPDLGRFVAVGWGGVPLYSSNGTTWSFGTVTPPSNHLNGVAYRPAAAGGPLFVAVGAGGEILTSPDGIHWTSQASGTGQDLRGVDYGYGSGLFVAVGANGTILASANGTSWTPHNASAPGTYLFGVVGDLCDRFVAVGEHATLRTLP